MEKILEMLEEKMEEHLNELGLELADIEYVSEGGYNYLRIYVEKPDGNTSLDDCVELSGRIDDIADELINEKFYLEVSTPGLERKLKRPKDFTRFTGRKVKIYTKSQVEEKKTFEGKLEKFENETIFLLDDTGKVYEIPFSKLKKSNLIYEIPANILESEEE
ncbi:ribosome maturation factor RimP [Leptotrichia sp. oral taxon 212]|jgi:ribosome maturation factor rimP|uniref:ribosome maturation factor RimP n=1 Tax=Leptotrichia sp. oral taxon 212 TaxID=712357 RepID=UPI0006A977DC|nr:ribosome maturation factor RimP [Leptotrichia sp. oral taxon 212]ALA95453.1 ribosome maturation protein RimP [Leptotrichia sp. oral taxon 212]